jgi:hypothetical protein
MNRINYLLPYKYCSLKEALKNLSHSQCSPDAAMAVSCLGRRNGGFSEAPQFARVKGRASICNASRGSASMKSDIFRNAFNWHLENTKTFEVPLATRLIHQLKISLPAWDQLLPGSAVRTPE